MIRPRLLLVPLFALAAGPLRAQDAAVTGRVTDASGAQPLAGVTVRLVGGSAQTSTDPDGGYRLTGLEAGTRTLRFERLGYRPVERTLELRTGAVHRLSLALEPTALDLDRIVVTATGRQSARRVASDVARVDVPDALEASTVTSFTDLLRARIPGLQVLGSSGTVGAGSRIRVRGASSINLPNEPVVYLDGVRIDTDPSSGSIDVGGQVPSRIHDLNPEEIASIELVRGPSAATLYGTDAAHGVLRVTTKRGRPGAEPEFSAWMELASTSDENDYPANWFGRSTGGSECFVFQQALGICEPGDPLISNPLRSPASTPFEAGFRTQTGASVAGGSDRIDYFFLAEWEREDGVFRLPDFDRAALAERMGSAFDDLPDSQFEPNALRRLNLRANVGGWISDRAELRVHVGFTTSELRLPQNGNNRLGVIASGLLGWPDGSAANRYGYRFLLPSDIYAQAVTQEVDRLITAASLDAELRPWLELRAVAGFDRITRTDDQLVPRGRVAFGTLPLGLRDLNTARVNSGTLDLGLTARRRLGGSWESRSTLGLQFVGRFHQRSDAHGEDLPPGSGSLADATFTTASEVRSESRTLGLFLEEEVAWRDQLFVGAALRADDNSAFGADYDLILYPKLGVSWVASEWDRFPELGWLDDLRVRTAWGHSGAQPGPRDALRTFDARAVTVDGDDDGLGVTLESLGNPDLDPERSVELEGGLDASLFGRRATVGLTGYRKTTRNLLLRQALPPSAGAGETRWVNLGEVANRGMEASIGARLVDRPDVAWRLDLTGSSNRNELIELGTQPNGEPLPPIVQGIQRFVAGRPLGGYWDRPIGYADLDGDGLIDPEEVAIADDVAYLGSSIPSRELTVGTEVALLGGALRASALLEYRGGHKLRNLTEVLRCQYTVCRGYNDPTASHLEQARALTQTILPLDRRTEAGFVEDAAFWKLRELGLTWALPAAWVGRAGAEAMTLTLSGRNLATWTHYSGLDPELNQFAQSGFLSRDLMTQPPVRTLSVRLRATF